MLRESEPGMSLHLKWKSLDEQKIIYLQSCLLLD